MSPENPYLFDVKGLAPWDRRHREALAAEQQEATLRNLQKRLDYLRSVSVESDMHGTHTDETASVSGVGSPWVTIPGRFLDDVDIPEKPEPGHEFSALRKSIQGRYVSYQETTRAGVVRFREAIQVRYVGEGGESDPEIRVNILPEKIILIDTSELIPLALDSGQVEYEYEFSDPVDTIGIQEAMEYWINPLYTATGGLVHRQE